VQYLLLCNEFFEQSYSHNVHLITGFNSVLWSLPILCWWNISDGKYWTCYHITSKLSACAVGISHLFLA